MTRTQRSASSSMETANGTAVSASASTMAASWEMRGDSVMCADHRTPRAPAEPAPLAHGPMSRRLLLRTERDAVHRDPAVLRVERHRRPADPATRLHVDAVQHARALAGLVGQAGEDVQLSGPVALGEPVDQRSAVAGRPDALRLALQVHGAERVLVERDLVDVVVVRVPPQVAVEPDVLREHRLVGVVDDPVGLRRGRRAGVALVALGALRAVLAVDAVLAVGARQTALALRAGRTLRAALTLGAGEALRATFALRAAFTAASGSSVLARRARTARRPDTG